MSLLTKVVVFGSDVAGEDSGVQLFLDEVANVNADGSAKTEFYPGDVVAMLLIVPPEFLLLSVQSTDGMVAATGSVSRTREDRVLFAEKSELLSLSQLPASAVSPKFYGKSATITVDKQSVTASAAPCIADLSYNYTARQYKLTAPGSLNIGTEEGDDWPIGVVVYVEAIK